MISFPRLLLACVFFGFIGLAPTAGMAVAIDDPMDPLNAPSVPTARAAQSAILDVTSAGAGILVAVGERGEILRSRDNGLSWSQAQTPVSVSLTAVKFVSESTGWAVGHSGVILATRDGGQTWTKQFDGLAASVEMARGGAADPPDKPFLALAFKDTREGVAVGANGMLFHTTDGGDHWHSWSDRLDNPETKHLYGAVWSAATLTIAGEGGAIFQSTDDGAHFTIVPSPYPGSFMGLGSTADDALLLFGLEGHAYRYNPTTRLFAQIMTGMSSTISAELTLRSKNILLASTSGELVCVGPTSLVATRIPVPGAYPFSGLAEAADGSVILSGIRGMARIGAVRC